MAQMTIRLDADLYASIQAAAQNAGKPMEAWAREALLAAARTPVVRERYGYLGIMPGVVSIKRMFSHPSGTVVTLHDVTQEAKDAVKRAELLVRRNEIGDRESAVALLKEHFELVVEVGI